MQNYLTKYEKVSMSSLKCERKKKHFEKFKTEHCYGLSFLDNYLFIRPENLKT